MITLDQAQFYAIQLILGKKYKKRMTYLHIPDYPSTTITLTEGNIMNIRQGDRVIYQTWSGVSFSEIINIHKQLQD